MIIVGGGGLMANVWSWMSRHKGLIFCLLVLIFFIFIGVYAGRDKNNLSYVNFNGQNEVYLSSKLPITDASGKSLDSTKIQSGIVGYAEFSVIADDIKADSLKYDIYLEDVISGNEFNYDYVKVYLTNEEDVPLKQFASNIVPSFANIRVSLDEPDKRVLTTGRIKKGEVKKFRLRVWLSDTYVLSDELKEFKGKISIKVS